MLARIHLNDQRDGSNQHESTSGDREKGQATQTGLLKLSLCALSRKRYATKHE